MHLFVADYIGFPGMVPIRLGVGSIGADFIYNIILYRQESAVSLIFLAMHPVAFLNHLKECPSQVH